MVSATSEDSKMAVGLSEADWPPETGRRLSVTRRFLLRPETGGFVSAAVVFSFFAVVAGGNGFLSRLGTADWVDGASQLGLVALPLGLLMIAGEFDLSIGSVVGATSIIVAICSGYYSLSPWIGIALSVVFGILVGLANGLITIWTKLPSFIVTLSSLLMISGGALGVSNWLTSASNITAEPVGSAPGVFASSWEGFDVSILWWLGLVGAATYVLQRTSFGNWVYATGGNAETARLAGVPTNRVKVSLFVATSLGAVLAGVVETLTFRDGNVTLGAQYVFTGIAAVVIGGVLLAGGYGSAIGTVFGSITYGIVSIGVFFLGWNADLTELFIGVFLLLAVVANKRLRQMAVGRA